MPELLTPGRKPTGPVEIDWAHPFAPNRACVLFNTSQNAVQNLTTGRLLTISAGSPVADINQGEKVIDFTTTEAILSDTQIALSNDIPNSITFRVKKNTGAANPGIFMGDEIVSPGIRNFIWVKQGSYIRYATNSGYHDFTSISTGFSSWHTYTITSDGGGINACTLRAYVDGVFQQQITGATGNIIITEYGQGYINTAYALNGWISFVYVHEGAAYSDGQVANLHKNPYQFLIPA